MGVYCKIFQSLEKLKKTILKGFENRVCVCVCVVGAEGRIQEEGTRKISVEAVTHPYPSRPLLILLQCSVLLRNLLTHRADSRHQNRARVLGCEIGEMEMGGIGHGKQFS